MLSGDDNKAILSYNEVASVFLEKKDDNHNKPSSNFDTDMPQNNMLNKNIAICFNNIACLHAK